MRQAIKTLYTQSFAHWHRKLLQKILTRILLSILMSINAFLKSALSAIGKRFLRSLRLVAQLSEPRVWVIRAASWGLHWRSHLQNVNIALKSESRIIWAYRRGVIPLVTYISTSPLVCNIRGALLVTYISKRISALKLYEVSKNGGLQQLTV